MSSLPESAKNVGHGHVFKRPDGMRMRCGGPGMCKICAVDLAALNLTKEASVMIDTTYLRGLLSERDVIVGRAEALYAAEVGMRSLLDGLVPLAIGGFSLSVPYDQAKEVVTHLLRVAQADLAVNTQRLRENGLMLEK